MTDRPAILTIEAAMTYAAGLLSSEEGFTVGAAREAEDDGIAMIHVDIVRDGVLYGRCDVWVESSGRLYGEW